MALENTNFDSSNDIAQFLEKFKEQALSSKPEDSFYQASTPSQPVKPADRSFEKLEKKIQELEEKFEVSATQNQLILNELAHTREEMSRQKSRDAFLDNISHTIASLKMSVENLSRAQQAQNFYQGPSFQRSFDPVPNVPVNPYLPTAEEVLHAETERHEQELAEKDKTIAEKDKELSEKEKVFSSLRQKASQLKAVNSALDREIKKVQAEKLDALRRSAEQAKEILSLREQLTAAEERFKSFNFEGRIISIRQEYEQKVAHLETQLKEISNTCMKQVEEIESLKAENTKLHQAAQERDVLQARLQEANAKIEELKMEMVVLEKSSSTASQTQLASYKEQLATLSTQRDQLAVELEQSKTAYEALKQEKELLEKNFKELLAKIENNEVVINQLKEQIAVLGQQNDTLTHANKELQAQTTSLTAQNTALTAQTRQLDADKAKLSQYASRLNQEKHHLEQTNKTLAQENQQLRNQSAAVLAAHLVKQKEQQKQAARNVAAQAEQPKPVTVAQKAPVQAPQPKPAAQPKQNVQPATQPKQAQTPAQAQPQATQPKQEAVQPAQAQAKVTTEADLPEIKVADPIPQPEPFDDGEDFLEKTDTFIGRIKWSVFHEDK